ncbi:hypothetical protein HK105_208787 [Polyrhizophydium stewartii]|uniref:Reelin domain-containing protein n=1 Tax=Polyrhizophydium stewartii TaxID=2732419 RepID=A0ABR4MWS6_9FUNG
MLFNALVAAAALLGSAVALPVGAPKCAINPAAIAAAHGKQADPSLGYGVSVKMTGANAWEMTVTNTAGRKAFQGILMYINKDMAPNTHLGKFEIDTNNFKFQSMDICSAAKVTGPMEATFTHSNPSKKPIDKTVFKWTATTEELNMPGQLMLNVAFADNDGDSAVKTKPRWHNMMMKLDCKPSGTMEMPKPKEMPMPTPSMPMGEPMIRKVIKCKPKKMMCPSCQSMPKSGY